MNPGSQTSPNSPTNIASSPAATDNTANLFGSVPLDNESNRSAPPTNWCSACRSKPWEIIRSRITNDNNSGLELKLWRHLHEDEAGEARSALGDPLVPCAGS
jgi:hypothetical protein